MESINIGTYILRKRLGRWGKLGASCDVRTMWLLAFSAPERPSIGQFSVEKMSAIEPGLREQRVLSYAKLLGI